VPSTSLQVEDVDARHKAGRDESRLRETGVIGAA
jgi:hypothetical protein